MALPTTTAPKVRTITPIIESSDSLFRKTFPHTALLFLSTPGIHPVSLFRICQTNPIQLLKKQPLKPNQLQRFAEFPTRILAKQPSPRKKRNLLSRKFPLRNSIPAHLARLWTRARSRKLPVTQSGRTAAAGAKENHPRMKGSLPMAIRLFPKRQQSTSQMPIPTNQAHVRRNKEDVGINKNNARLRSNVPNLTPIRFPRTHGKFSSRK